MSVDTIVVIGSSKGIVMVESRPRKSTVGHAVVLACMVFPLSVRADDASVLELIRKSHVSSIESVRTLQLEMEWTVESIEGGRPVKQRASFWWDGARTRVIQSTYAPRLRQGKTEYANDPSALLDVIVDDRIENRYAVSKRLNGREVRMGELDVRGEGMIEGISLDPWELGKFIVSARPLVWFRDVFTAEHSPTLLSKSGEKDIYKVGFRLGNNQASVEVQPSVNYLVRRFESISTEENGQKRVFETNILEFAEPVKGIFFPSRLRTRMYTIDPNGDQRETYVGSGRMFNIRINQVVDESHFERPFPPETHVVDRRENTYVQWGDNGPKSAPKPVVPVAGVPHRPWWPWLIASGAVFAVLGFFIWRRRLAS